MIASLTVIAHWHADEDGNECECDVCLIYTEAIHHIIELPF